MTLGHFGALGRTVSAVSLSAYLSHRDGSHALRAPPLWEGNSTRFAARVWDLSLRGRASRGKKVRHIWELRWHGEIKAITDPANGAALSRCGLCAHPSCSLAHIFFEQASIMTLFTSQNGSHLSSSLASCPALFSQHLWLGHYPPPSPAGARLITIQPLALREVRLRYFDSDIASPRRTATSGTAMGKPSPRPSLLPRKLISQRSLRLRRKSPH